MLIVFALILGNKDMVEIMKANKDIFSVMFNELSPAPVPDVPPVTVIEGNLTTFSDFEEKSVLLPPNPKVGIVIIQRKIVQVFSALHSNLGFSTS